MTLLRAWLLILIILLGLTPLHAQVNTTDSLWQQWQQTTLSDSLRLKSLNEFIWDGLLFNNPDSALTLLKAQMAFAEETGSLRYQSEALNGMGVAKFYTGKYDDALEFFEQNLELCQQLADSSRLAGTLSNMGNIHMRQGNFPMARKYLEESIETDRAIGNNPGVSTGLNNLANVYHNLGNDARAIDYYHQSLKIKETLGDDRGAAGTLTNIGVIQAALEEHVNARNNYQRAIDIYNKLEDSRGAAVVLSNLALLEEKEGTPNRAKEYHEQSLQLRRSIGDRDGEAVSLNNLGVWHKQRGDYAAALQYLEESLALRETLNDEKGTASTLSTMAGLMMELNQESQALQTAERAIQIARSIDSPAEISKAAATLADIYRKIGRPEQAIAMIELNHAMQDSLMSEKNQRAVIRQQYQYDYEKRALADSLAFAVEREIVALQVARQKAELKQQRIALISAAGGVMLLMVLAVVIFRSKKRSDELLLNILPAETAKELKTKGSADARLIENVTVLFTDFKGFTQMSEAVTPKQLVKDLHECFSAFDRICEKYGVEKIKTIGDAYMAAGGLPIPSNDHPEKVIRAALEMRDFVEEGKQRKIANNLPFFEIRIGVHTGPVVAGIVGVKKFQYDIWGDTVNTASRMESSGEVGKVNISESTYNLVKNQFTCEYRGEIEAKGKGKLGMYFVSESSEK